MRVQVGPFSGYRTYFVAWFLLDADALARFAAKLTAGEMLDVQPELGIMARVWSGYGPPEPPATSALWFSAGHGGQG